MIKKALALLKRIAKAYIETGKYIGKLIIGSGAMYLAMVPAAILTHYILTKLGMPMGSLEASNPFPFGMTKIELAAAMLAVGIIEENIYRYFLMDCLFIKVMNMRFTFAWVLSSVLFGAMHLMNTPYNLWLSAPQAVGATFCGLLLAKIYQKYGLHQAILTHALYDFIILAYLS